MYAVSVVSGASTSSTSTKESDRFMHMLSSNYPSAFCSGDNWSNLNIGTGDTNKGYYLVAKNSSELTAAFGSISDSVLNPVVDVPETAKIKNFITNRNKSSIDSGN